MLLSYPRAAPQSRFRLCSTIFQTPCPMLYRSFDTQAQIDAQYNPSIALPDSAAPGKHFAAQADKARSTLKHHAGIPFGPTVH